ncbi:Streptomyces sporulation and cell division protein, SsgA [Streptomyces zhaozhouensis]|uniref:Streptomyces sporulation and cell division protein, SsgA n=1 Tax=Streptomyces zhaozhouensis TaxID=1300267 RepID=A0A286E276_9ACTN|nr:Streptomyces sporulation and cell division protein, SsgA [Streptomyces zhaozhouensis]
MQTIIERELDVRLVLAGERSIPVPARLTYRSDDPFAVHVTFHIGSDSPVHWTFARELLVEGIFRPAGQGDVRVWPESPEDDERLTTTICLSLRSPDGDALLRIPGHSLAAWLERTLRVVPPGGEARGHDLDGELAALLTAPFAGCGECGAPFGDGGAGPAAGVEGAARHAQPEERHERAADELAQGPLRAPGLPDLSRLTDLTDLVGLFGLGRPGDGVPLADPGVDLPDRGEGPDVAGDDGTGEAAG